jgi:hypothetical protein
MPNSSCPLDIHQHSSICQQQSHQKEGNQALQKQTALALEHSRRAASSMDLVSEAVQMLSFKPCHGRDRTASEWLRGSGVWTNALVPHTKSHDSDFWEKRRLELDAGLTGPSCTTRSAMLRMTSPGTPATQGVGFIARLLNPHRRDRRDRIRVRSWTIQLQMLIQLWLRWDLSGLG